MLHYLQMTHSHASPEAQTGQARWTPRLVENLAATALDPCPASAQLIASPELRFHGIGCGCSIRPNGRSNAQTGPLLREAQGDDIGKDEVA